MTLLALRYKVVRSHDCRCGWQEGVAAALTACVPVRLYVSLLHCMLYEHGEQNPVLY